MELQERIDQLLGKYSAEKKEFSNPLYVYRRRRCYSKVMLSGQISSILVEAIDEICKASGFAKCAVIEHLIFTGLNNTEFDKKTKSYGG